MRCLRTTAAAGKLRHIEVGIERSVFQPLAVPQMIEECFDQILATTAAIIGRRLGLRPPTGFPGAVFNSQTNLVTTMVPFVFG